MSEQVTIHVIAGPTASGKSALALSKAKNLNGVIINADSVQVYDALPTLTAQPSQDEQGQFSHRLYGVMEPAAWCSAGNWREMAINEIEKTLEEGKTPIVVGGSGLYIKALVEGFSPIPDIPDEVRARVIALQEKVGNPAFHGELAKRDPVMAARFHPQHTARLIRAYEVLEATGKSLAEFQDMPKEQPPAHWHFDVTLVMPDKTVLDERCAARFAWMMENGAVEEVAGFMTRTDIADNAPIRRALGLAPLSRWLAGKMDKDAAITRGILDTRQYAKRQLTWFRHQVRPAEQVTIRHITQ